MTLPYPASRCVTCGQPSVWTHCPMCPAPEDDHVPDHCIHSTPDGDHCPECEYEHENRAPRRGWEAAL